MKRIFFVYILISFLCGCVFAYNEDFSDLENDDGNYIETIASAGVPNLNARAAVLYDATYGRILYEKNSMQARANASTTKMITALVACEKGNLSDIVEVSKNAASTGGSSINLKAGDRISLNDLIHGLLIHSGNDAAVAIAEYIAGNIDDFSQMMNEKAEEIGAINTHFVTPHGLDEDNHYSTAFDLALIAKELLNNDYLSKVVSKTSAEINVNGIARIIRTTNEMLSVYEGTNGVKTGYTGNAGRCIVTSAKKDGRQLISVVLGCDSKKNRTIDSIRLLDYGFNGYNLVNLGDFVNKDMRIVIEKSRGGTYVLKKQLNILYPIRENEINLINVEYETRKGLIAPIKKGEYVGKVIIKLDGNIINEIEYTMPEDVGRKTWKDYFIHIYSESLKDALNFTKLSFIFIK